MRILHFHRKDFLALTTPDGNKLGVYRHHLHGEKLAPWMPHSGIIACPGKTVPVTPDTRDFWNNLDHPGYGDVHIKRLCSELDSQHLPVGKEASPEEINSQLGEKGEELNEELRRMDCLLVATDRPRILDSAQKAQQLEPRGLNLISEIAKIARARVAGERSPRIGQALATVAICILAAMGTGKADMLDDQVREAHTIIQKMTGQEIKAMLEAIPEKERVELVILLPNGVMPGFMPKEFAAKNIKLAPSGEIKKGFDRMTETQLVDTAKKADTATVRALLSKVQAKGNDIAMR